MTCNLMAMQLSKHDMCTMSVMGLKGAKQALDPDIKLKMLHSFKIVLIIIYS